MSLFTYSHKTELLQEPWEFAFLLNMVYMYIAEHFEIMSI